MSTMSLYDLDKLIERGPNSLLHDIQMVDTSALQDVNQSPFQDTDGLISFVNMSSSLVTANPQYKTGQKVCDKISSFFATLRIKVFGFLMKNPHKLLPGDTAPTTQWDPAVTHYMQFLLTQAGGLTNYKISSEIYSVTQLLSEFSTTIIKLILDAAAIPEAFVTDAVKFVKGVGETLRTTWDDKSKTYSLELLSQCHEAVSADGSGNTLVYFPKIKYYSISVDSAQQVFTSPCNKLEKLTFNFKYEYYVTGLKASVLDETSPDHINFVTYLDKAQGISYKEATNSLDAILADTVSINPSSQSAQSSDANPFGVVFDDYPRVTSAQPKLIEQVLNRRR